MYRDTYIKINTDAIKHNVENAVNYVGKDIRMLAVVKSDAYGHGSVRVALSALSAGASFLAVAIAEEAVPLREAGIDVPILILGVSNDEQIKLACSYNLDVCIACTEDLESALAVAKEKGHPLRVHLKTDTGMGRIGFRSSDDFIRALDIIGKSDAEYVGLFSHLACADTDDLSFNKAQQQKFEMFRKLSYDRGFSPICHLANSAALMSDDRSLHYDMVRFGISLYGYYPSECVTKSNVALEKAMSVHSKVAHVKTLHEGESVSYGATYVADCEKTIATVPVGYGDGYNRLLSNKGRMIVVSEGRAYYAPITGRVCMDQTMIDVTGIPGVKKGTDVVLLGRAYDKEIDADEIAGICGTISYEILLDFTSRVPRI